MIFRADNFSDCDDYESMAFIANKLFSEWLDKQPVIYGRDKQWDITDGKPDAYVGCTHKARLCMIEPIVQEHECVPNGAYPIFNGSTFQETKTNCKICGAEIKPIKWERVK